MNDIVYYETGSTDAPYNLAMEEALADAVSQGAQGSFLLWQNSPAVIIGRNQNAFSEVNLAELRQRGYHLVRRMTGGGAVYHDLGNLNFSFILPLDQYQEPKAEELLAPLIAYFKSLGAEVVMEGRNDLSIVGKGKFSGLASRRLPNGWQLHGTIMFDVDTSVLEHVLLVDPEKYRSKGVASVRARVTNLKEHIDIDLFQLWAGIKAVYGYEEVPIPEDIRMAARKLADQKYGIDAWNIGQSPPSDIMLKRRFPFGSLQLHLRTRKNEIVEARLTGDFLAPSQHADLLPIEKLEAALIGQPADQPDSWRQAWQSFDLTKAFHGQVDQTEIEKWLSGA